MTADEDMIITVDSLDDPIDTTVEEPVQRQGPVRIKVPGRDTPKTTPARASGTQTDDAVEDLRGQLTAAQQRERDANRRAAEATETARGAIAQVEQARTTIADTRVGAIDAEIASATTESASIKSALKAAMDAGDFEKATDLQEKLADARARLLDAQRQKVRIAEEGEITRTHEGAVREPQRQQQRQVNQTPEERRQAILAGLTPLTRAWIENHQDILDNPERGEEARRVHHRALGAGLEPDTPEYFRFAEKEMGYTQVTKTNRQTEPRQNGNGRQVVESAPVDRGGGGGNDGGGGGGLRVELTRGEYENATNGTLVWNTGPNKGKPIGTKEMARRKAIMQQDGRYANPAVS